MLCAIFTAHKFKKLVIGKKWKAAMLQKYEDRIIADAL